jgi:hypothetical protein
VSKSMCMRGHGLGLGLGLFLGLATACSSDTSTGPTASSFLKGTNGNAQIGLVLNSTSPALTMFQLGAPHGTQQTVPFGASSSITPVGFSINGTTAVVPLGDVASVAVVNLNTLGISYFLFNSGNATGQAFIDANTVVVGNLTENYVGAFTLTQSSSTIGDSTPVAPGPTDIEAANGNAYVISENLDINSNPLGNGVVTKMNGHTLAVLATASTGGTNATAAAVGPDGRLYVVNTGDYVGQSSLTVLDTATLSPVGNGTYPNFGVGAGAIQIDKNGLAYVSGFFSGTVVWNTVTQSFVRSASSPLCVLLNGSCLGAFGAATDAAGDVYQAYFGTQGGKPWVYVYSYAGGSYTLSDSISAGQGPSEIRIATF